jgi:hypothetical protein
MNYIPTYETTYPGMKLHTQVWNYIPKYETTYPGMTIDTQVWNLIPNCKTICEKTTSDTLFIIKAMYVCMYVAPTDMMWMLLVSFSAKLVNM